MSTPEPETVGDPVLALQDFAAVMVSDYQELAVEPGLSGLCLEEEIFTQTLNQCYLSWNQGAGVGLRLFQHIDRKVRFAAMQSVALYATPSVVSDDGVLADSLRKVNARLALDVGWAVVYTQMVHRGKNSIGFLAGAVRLHEHPLYAEMVAHMAAPGQPPPTLLEVALFFHAMLYQ